MIGKYNHPWLEREKEEKEKKKKTKINKGRDKNMGRVLASLSFPSVLERGCFGFFDLLAHVAHGSLVLCLTGLDVGLVCIQVL